MRITLVWALTFLLTESLCAEPCAYINKERIYDCKDITDVFPNVYYGNFNLKCTNCDLEIFSDQTFPYDNSLVTFNVSGSNIHYVTPKAFSKLGNVQYIYLQNNQIVNISENAFAGLRQLYEIRMDNNMISKLSYGFLQDLECNFVNLSNNKIVEIPNSIFDGSLSVMSIDLSNNEINKLNEESFIGLDIMENLYLQNNKLCYIPLGIFKTLGTLRHLDLSNNKFTRFQIGTFSGLRNLHNLILANNKINEFDGNALIPFQRLSKLDISRNGMYYMDANNIHANSPTLRFINFDENLFSCALLTSSVLFFKKVNVEVVNSIGRYNIQNINGIPCIDKPFQETISYEYFLQIAEKDTKKNIRYC